jgi:hypothetical protein
MVDMDEMGRFAVACQNISFWLQKQKNAVL